MANTKIPAELSSTPSISDSGDATAITINSSEDVFVGSGTSNGISGGTSGLQVSGAGFKGTISASRHENNQYGSSLMLGKSRNTTVGSNTIVQDNDAIGAIGFFADDGTNLDSQVAYIIASIDGTPAANDTPGRLTFSTTADGSAAVTERMRIDSSGNVGIGTSSPSKVLTISGDDAEFLLNRTGTYADTINMGMPGGIPTIAGGTHLAFGGNGTWNEHMRITSDGKVGIGKTDPNYPLVVAGTNPKIQIYDSDGNGQTNLYFGDSGSNLAGYVIYQHSDNKMRLGTNATDRMSIDSSGSIIMNNLYGSAADQNDVRYNASSGLLFYNTSSRRYKENIKDMPDGVLDKVKQARVVTFDEKESGISSYGLIAEELDELIPELVTRKEIDGELVPESIVYSKIGVWVLKAMQEQQTIIEDLKARIETLEG